VTDSTDTGSEGTWAALRRRKVAQWALAYVAVGWGLLQGLEYVASAFHWPEQLQRVAIVVFAVGLPIAVVVAWFHGDRGHQGVVGGEIAILAILLTIGAGGAWWVWRMPAESAASAGELPVPRPVGDAVEPSIAVLPFVNLSSDPEQDYFSDGLAEQVLDLLARVSELRVIARTSSFSFRGKDADIAAIARKLNVSHVLEGSVRKSGNRLRITAQLIRADDSSHLWSQSYDRELTDIFAIQDEIAAAVVQQLELKLLGGRLPARPTTGSPEAYQAYLRALYLDTRRGAGDLQAARGSYQRALELDPRFAPAWAGLARMHVRSAMELDADDDWERAREAANQALEIDPDNAEGHAALAWIRTYHDWDWAGAKAAADRAVELEPGNARVVSTAGMVYFYIVGDQQRGIELMRRAVSLDPVRLAGHNNLGWSLMRTGQLEESWASFETARTLSVDPSWTDAPFGQLLLLRGDATAALERMQKVAGNLGLAGQAVAYSALGHKQRSDEMLGRLKAVVPAPESVLLAYVHAYRGERDEALQWLERAYLEHSGDLVEIRGHPLLKNLESDPRYRDFLRAKLKLPDS
jgi:TolB-like protein/Tfp pilus assembly protein PilF